MGFFLRMSAHRVVGLIAQLIRGDIMVGTVSDTWRVEHEMEAAKH
jgi:hypothetical protein